MIATGTGSAENDVYRSWLTNDFESLISREDWDHMLGSVKEIFKQLPTVSQGKLQSDFQKIENTIAAGKFPDGFFSNFLRFTRSLPTRVRGLEQIRGSSFSAQLRQIHAATTRLQEEFSAARDKAMKNEKKNIRHQLWTAAILKREGESVDPVAIGFQMAFVKMMNPEFVASDRTSIRQTLSLAKNYSDLVMFCLKIETSGNKEFHREVAKYFQEKIKEVSGLGGINILNKEIFSNLGDAIAAAMTFEKFGAHFDEFAKLAQFVLREDKGWTTDPNAFPMQARLFEIKDATGFDLQDPAFAGQSFSEIFRRFESSVDQIEKAKKMQEQEKKVELDAETNTELCWALFELAKYLGYSGQLHANMLKDFFHPDHADRFGIYWKNGSWHVNNLYGLDRNVGRDGQTLGKIMNFMRTERDDILSSRFTHLFGIKRTHDIKLENEVGHLLKHLEIGQQKFAEQQASTKKQESAAAISPKNVKLKIASRHEIQAADDFSFQEAA